jgi:hypothetical protein
MAQPDIHISTLSNQEILALENQITELAAHIHAASYHLLTLIRQYDWLGPVPDCDWAEAAPDLCRSAQPRIESTMLLCPHAGTTTVRAHASENPGNCGGIGMNAARFNPPFSPPFRHEAPPGAVAGPFRDREGRRRTRLYGEDPRPSETAQTRGLAVPQ